MLPASVLRKKFATALSRMFAGEVPEYQQFVEIVAASNRAYLANHPDAEVDAEDRVLAEKHGAIRVGTPEELRMMTRIFAVFGMHPVEFYDMTQLPKGALPIIATAFRPIDENIAQSAFRMFCSLLHHASIPVHLKAPIEAALAHRGAHNPKFSSRLQELLLKAEQKNLNDEEADIFIAEVVNSLRIDKSRPIDFSLYRELRALNDVFADIVCIGMNINHLTPRAYDIADAANRVAAAGIALKDGGIEGPPMREDAPPIQLNQTSRKAPGELLYVALDATLPIPENPPHIAMQPDETVAEYMARIATALDEHPVVAIDHKARFGEIEARGVALTVAGETLYRTLLAEKKFRIDFPKTHTELFLQGLAYYTVQLNPNRPVAKPSNTNVKTLVQEGFALLHPQTYDDFLAASAAGIFKSNMSTGVAETGGGGGDTLANKRTLEAALGTPILNRHDLHKAAFEASLKALLHQLDI